MARQNVPKRIDSERNIPLCVDFFEVEQNGRPLVDGSPIVCFCEPLSGLLGFADRLRCGLG
jgi:hypothetical protein